MMSVSLLKASFTLGAVGFLAYCVYFDRKRRSDPDFKKKLRERRKKAKTETESQFDIPILTNKAEMEAYFFKEVELGDKLLSTGNYNEAVIHLANAIVVCSNKTNFIATLQKTLPPPIFQLLIQVYTVVNKRYIKKIFEENNLQNMPMFQSGERQFIDDTDIE